MLITAVDTTPARANMDGSSPRGHRDGSADCRVQGIRVPLSGYECLFAGPVRARGHRGGRPITVGKLP